MRKFKIDKDWKDVGCTIYQKGTITIESGVTILVGCNGIGKTTLIQQLIHQLKQENIPVISFDNLHDGGFNARQNTIARQDFAFAGTSMCSSEGENINLNIAQFAGNDARNRSKTIHFKRSKNHDSTI